MDLSTILARIDADIKARQKSKAKNYFNIRLSDEDLEKLEMLAAYRNNKKRSDMVKESIAFYCEYLKNKNN